MYDDELHLKAAEYANHRKERFDAAVKEAADPPPRYIQDIYRWLWVSHYEGYKNGYKAKLKENT